MTTLLAIRENDSVWVGSDRRFSRGTSYIDSDHKWTFGERWAIGWCGEARSLSVLRGMVADWGIFDGNVYGLTLRLREMFEADRYTAKEGSGPYNAGAGNALITNGISLWAICSDSSICKIPAGIAYGDGTGGCEAEGAARALEPFVSHPGQRIRRAIEVAISMDSVSGGVPFIAQVMPDADGSILRIESAA